ncbi:MAG: hypothetical protein K6A31_01570, partial [Fibrobacter sp.]|nr:hypothetical protein [Fibrobacter sp.]
MRLAVLVSCLALLGACSTSTIPVEDDESSSSKSSSSAKSVLEDSSSSEDGSSSATETSSSSVASSDSASSSSAESAESSSSKDPSVCEGTSGKAWDGTTAKEFACGSGTKLSPYIILTAEQLALLAFVTNAQT